MNAVIDNMMSRVSCKKFSDKMPSREDIELLIDAGLRAPSGRNRQAPVIIAITNKEVRDTLSRTNAGILGADGIDPFYNAPCILLVIAKKNTTHVYDGSCTAQNILLAAHSLGLGACWIHRAKEELEQPEIKAMLQELGLTDEYEGIANIVVGYPAEDFHKDPVPVNDGRKFFIE